MTSTPKLIRHEKPEDALLLMANCDPDLPVADLSEIGIGGVNETGAEFDVSGEDAIAGIAEQKCWGFCDTKTGEIHAWVAPDCPPETLLEFLGHELGHLTGTPCADELEEEMRANLFGEVAAQAYRLMTS
jgi:hypothetical protein